MIDGPIAELRRRSRAGELEPDPWQELAAEKLQSLHNALRSYEPARAGSWKARFGLARRAEDPPQGLYLHGDVGRGKSMLMDMFFAAAPLERKRRVHFHEFMLELHETMHRWRHARAAHRNVDDMLAAFAEAVAADAWLLCFDEFHVSNIADAMLLGRLFEALFARGVIVVATSNWAPDELYQDGLQRDRFLPFIELIKARLDVLELAAPTDYRLARLKGMPVYHVPPDAAAERALDEAFARLTDGAPGAPARLVVNGRGLDVPRAAAGVARFSFAELCERPLGPADYLAIAERFRAVILSAVPRLGPRQRDEAKRFATLVDALYERHVTLICSAEAPPEALYPEGEGARDFKRAASRLAEMQSAGYMSAD